MSVGKTGGLNWFGVGKAGGGSQNTSTSVLLNRSKRQRQEEALRGRKVGSAAIQSADDWLAAADANRKFRERDGAVGNPFASAAALVAESRRQNKRPDHLLDWSLPAGDAVPAAATRVPSLYWDDPKDLNLSVDGAVDAAASVDEEAAASSSGERQQDEAPPATRETTEREGLSREELREIEVSVMELRDTLEGDSRADDKCDALRRDLIQQQRRRRHEEQARPQEARQEQHTRPLHREDRRFDDDGVLDDRTPSDHPPANRGLVVEFDDEDDSAPISFDQEGRLPSLPPPPPPTSGGIVVDFDDDDDD